MVVEFEFVVLNGNGTDRTGFRAFSAFDIPVSYHDATVKRLKNRLAFKGFGNLNDVDEVWHGCS
jgi:hypothetical protein